MSPDTRPERVVIKIGTSSLISAGLPDPAKLTALADAVVRLRAEGRQPVLVASGAIAAGEARLARDGLRPATAARQAAAAVGQGLLFDAFRRAFDDRGLIAAQLLLTPPDLIDTPHRDSAYAMLDSALEAGLVPVVNENDAVKVRNNDVLAALVAAVLRAGTLVLLTDVPGLHDGDPRQDPAARLIPEVKVMTAEVERRAGGSGGGPGTGGMAAKVCAAWIGTMAGVTTVIAGADTPDGVVRAVAGDDVGTVVHPRSPSATPAPARLWAALSEPPAGRLRCGPEVLRALDENRPVTGSHVHSVTGPFAAGSVVDVVVADRVVARGRVGLGHDRCADGDDPLLIHPARYLSLLEA
ncbi:glutamate 5-kinase [Streptomyces albidoflavus]|uniref:glutamate 5-kinase n=1 Tax=Streptomyces albidoflavus TaxID=1886 RepID=UPI0033A190FE